MIRVSKDIFMSFENLYEIFKVHRFWGKYSLCFDIHIRQKLQKGISESLYGRNIFNRIAKGE